MSDMTDDPPTDIAQIDTFPSIQRMEEERRMQRRHRLRDGFRRLTRTYWHAFCYGRRDYGVANWRAGHFYFKFNFFDPRTREEEIAWGKKRHVQPEIGCEWSLAPRGLHPTHSIGIRFEAYNDHDWTAHVELFDVAIYLFGKSCYPMRLVKWLSREPKGRDRSFSDEREISLRWFEGTLWWCLFWPTDSWYSTDPKWRHGHWNPMDAIFGQVKYQRLLRREGAHETVDLPEYHYPCHIQISDNYWTRPRKLLWHQFEKKVVRAEVEFTEYAPPHAGKGENSWDCDDDATYSITMPIPDGTYDEIEWARGAARESIMRTRKKTGDRGANWNYKANPVKRLPAVKHEPIPWEPRISEIGNQTRYLVSDGDNPGLPSD